jgi:hypothetical protein
VKHRYLTFSGWISLIANLLAIAGFFLERWPPSIPQPNQGFWIVLSFVTTAYSLVIWSMWAWQRSTERGLQQADGGVRGGIFLLNAMAALPALTIWLYLALAALDLTISLRWILALAVAWAGTPFIAMGLTWTGATLGPILNGRSIDRG